MSGASRQVTEGDFHAGSPAWSPDGGTLAFVAAMDDDRDLTMASDVYTVPAAGGAFTRLTGGEIIFAAVWWLGDTIVAAGLPEKVSHTRLYRVVPGTGATEIVTGLDRNVMTGHPGYPGATPQLLGDDLLFCARDRGLTHLYRLPEGAAEAVKEEGGQVTVSGVSSAAGVYAHVAATPYSAGEVFLDGEQLTAYAPGDLELFAPSTRVFTAPDGTEVEGFVLRDENRTGPGPLLLDIHGGPHNAWAPVFDGAHLYHQVLAARGWTVLTLNPRASDGYGEAFFTAAVGAWGLADDQDFLGPLDDLVAEGVADPERLAVTGYSYGGYMTCWLSTQTGRFRAAVPGGIVADLASMAGTSDMGYYLKEHENGGEVVKQSPMTHVDQVTTPTLILHGDGDDRCPVGQAEQWFAALRERGVPVRLVRYPGASHLFIVQGRPSHRFDYNERVITWLEQWVSGSPN